MKQLAFNLTSGSEHLRTLWLNTSEWERIDGYSYYDRQRERLDTYAERMSVPLPSVVGAFAALSPNNSEKSTYVALDICLRIAVGELPPSTSVVAYPENKNKALRILGKEEPLAVLQGLKTRAFFANTINPDDSTQLTIDGHMISAWLGRRIGLKSREASISKTRYQEISHDVREVAEWVHVSAPRFQATLWLAWKRQHSILSRQSPTTQQLALALD